MEVVQDSYAYADRLWHFIEYFQPKSKIYSNPIKEKNEGQVSTPAMGAVPTPLFINCLGQL